MQFPFLKRFHRHLLWAMTGLVALTFPLATLAHCDTMDGPVIIEARAALNSGDVTPLLKWVAADQEADIRAAFDQTMTVRKQGDAARELADHYFFETLVRIHRAGEGAPYEGIKPSGEQEHSVMAADKALETGSITMVENHLNSIVQDGLNERFQRVTEAKKHASENVDAGREFVAAYVEYVHYVERLFNDVQSNAVHHAEGEAGGHSAEHKH